MIIDNWIFFWFFFVPETEGERESEKNDKYEKKPLEINVIIANDDNSIRSIKFIYRQIYKYRKKPHQKKNNNNYNDNDDVKKRR